MSLRTDTSGSKVSSSAMSAMSQMLLIQRYESQCVNKKLVDEKSHRYLMNTTWVEDRFSQDKYKLAYFHFLLRKGSVSPELYIPEANIQLVQDQVLENDD